MPPLQVRHNPKMSGMIPIPLPTKAIDNGTETSNLGPKSKKNRKKKAAGKSKVNRDLNKPNGLKIDEEEVDGVEANDDEPPTPLDELENSVPSPSNGLIVSDINGASENSASPILPNDATENSIHKAVAENEVVDATELGQSISPDESPRISGSKASSVDTEASLDKLAHERTVLRAEVAQLRRSLEEIQERHEEDVLNYREQLKESRGEKEHAEMQYRNLLGKVNTIRSQLGERLKADAVGFPIFFYLLPSLAYFGTGRPVASKKPNRRP